MFIGGFELNPELFNNLIPSFFTKIEESITSNVSFFNDALEVVINLFNYLSNIIIWLSSYSGLSVFTVITIVSIIAGGIGVIISTFAIKLIVRWWSVLVP